MQAIRWLAEQGAKVIEMVPFGIDFIQEFALIGQCQDAASACSNSWYRSRGGSYLRGSILAQGDLDIHLIISILKQSGFDGSIFIEYEGMEDCEYGTKISLWQQLSVHEPCRCRPDSRRRA